MNMIEELWYGNVNPTEQSIRKGSEYALALQKMVEEQDRVLPLLSKEQQRQVENLLDAQMSAAVIAERDAFVQGFRLAVHLLLDGLSDPIITM